MGEFLLAMRELFLVVSASVVCVLGGFWCYAQFRGTKTPKQPERHFVCSICQATSTDSGFCLKHGFKNPLKPITTKEFNKIKKTQQWYEGGMEHGSKPPYI